MANLEFEFAQQKYAVLRHCVTEPQLSLLYRYARRRAKLGAMTHDRQVPEALSAYGDVFMDGLLTDLLPAAERATGKKLFPTYSYLRVYKRGDMLAKHQDRPSCEISLTVCLGYAGDEPWPLLIDAPGGVSSIELNPGDALVYRGVECPHWREPLIGDHAVQVFLHYVDQNGPLAEWKFDKRSSLSPKRLVEE